MDSTFDKSIPKEDCSSPKHCQSDCTGNRRRVYIKGAEPRKCRKARGSDVAKRGRFRARPSQLSRTMSLRIMAREYIWLWDYRHGLNAQGDRDSRGCESPEGGVRTRSSAELRTNRVTVVRLSDRRD